jgi:hypothetical protein
MKCLAYGKVKRRLSDPEQNRRRKLTIEVVGNCFDRHSEQSLADWTLTATQIDFLVRSTKLPSLIFQFDQLEGASVFSCENMRIYGFNTGHL